jgi:hypothetical protein
MELKNVKNLLDIIEFDFGSANDHFAWIRENASRLRSRMEKEISFLHGFAKGNIALIIDMQYRLHLTPETKYKAIGFFMEYTTAREKEYERIVEESKSSKESGAVLSEMERSPSNLFLRGVSCLQIAAKTEETGRTVLHSNSEIQKFLGYICTIKSLMKSEIETISHLQFKNCGLAILWSIMTFALSCIWRCGTHGSCSSHLQTWSHEILLETQTMSTKVFDYLLLEHPSTIISHHPVQLAAGIITAATRVHFGGRICSQMNRWCMSIGLGKEEEIVRISEEIGKLIENFNKGTYQ